MWTKNCPMLEVISKTICLLYLKITLIIFHVTKILATTAINNKTNIAGKSPENSRNSFVDQQYPKKSIKDRQKIPPFIEG